MTPSIPEKPFDAGTTFDAGDTFDTGDTFAAGETFATDEAFEIPETSFDGIQEALEESGISGMATPVADDDGGFTFDLDDDEPPASLVTPPADMMDSSTGVSSEPAPAFSDDGSQDFDIDIDFDITPDESPDLVGTDAVGAHTGAATSSAAVDGDEFDIDWPADDALELPDVAAPANEAVEPAYDLDETLPATRAEPTIEPFELEAFELGEPSLEPVEHVVTDPVPATGDVGAGSELEIQLDDLDLEPPSFDAVELDAPAEAPVETPEPAVRDDAAEVQAQFDQRREEDLLAEAKVFFKYGLQEKARDRLGELFQVRPDHLEGLDLQTRIDLDAEQFSDALASANLVSRLAAEQSGSGDEESAAGIWKALKENAHQGWFDDRRRPRGRRAGSEGRPG